MEKTNRRIEALCIIALLVIMLPSADYLAKKAFADLAITIITPTGGALGATSDCNDITSGNGIIWHACNGVLYAIEDVTNTVVAELAIATLTTGDIFLATVSGTSVIILDVANDVRKYTLSGSTISLAGVFNPTGCATDQDMQYDILGYIWVTCGAEDIILRFNPNTMTETSRSQDLTDGAGIECDLPGFVSYDATSNNVGVIRCVTTGNIVTFSVTSPTTVTLLDSDAGTIGTSGVFTHDRYKRIFAVDNVDVEVWTYTVGGITTLSQTISGVSDDCHIEPYVASDIFLLCVDDSGTNTLIGAYFSNATQVTQILNTAQAFDNSVGVGFDIQDQTWYVSSSLNDQRYIRITGLRDTIVNPDPPAGGDGSNIIGGVDCSLPENEFKLICRVTDPIGGAGNFVIGNGTSGLTGIGCSIGLVDCETDSNPRTNGLGLLIFISSLFVVVASFYLTIGRQAFVIPVYIWIVIILALSAFFTITGLIDPIFLILTAVALIALAAIRIQGFISGKGFGGGSTE